MVDIVERLRKPVDDIFFGEVVEPIKWEAADEIERLRKQERKMTNHALERMEEIERLQEEHHDVRILNEQYYNENAILTAEIERLREALHNIYRKTSDDHIMQMVDDALQQKESE